jgi:hypothetical protein
VSPHANISSVDKKLLGEFVDVVIDRKSIGPDVSHAEFSETT